MKLLVNLDVPDLTRAAEFYCAALGLTLTRIIDGDVAELTGASSTLYLLQKDAQTKPVHGADATRDYARHWTPVHFDVVVADVDTAVRRAIAAGARQESEPVHWQGSKCVSLGDPFGHGFCFIEFDNGASYQP